MAIQISSKSLLTDGPIDYNQGLALQREIHSQVAAGLGRPTIIYLEHQDVYTAGKRTQANERPCGDIKVIDVDRGGKITWHGIGQLVAYPIIKLANAQEVVGYVRNLEGAIIKVLTHFNLHGVRIPDRSGVWIKDEKGERKIAAIGIRIASGVTMHGIAINANPNLAAYSSIIACGIVDATVTSISEELGSNITISQLAPILEQELELSLQELIAQPKELDHDLNIVHDYDFVTVNGENDEHRI